jgi:nickel transport protein
MQLNRLHKSIKPIKPIKPQFILPLVLLSILGLQTRTLAHGVVVDYRETQAIEITSLYDTGEPMANAQVIIYAPEDPSTPWMTGTTTETGLFTFTPDRSQAGNWEVAIRQAGHGEILSIPVESDSAASEDAGSTPTADRSEETATSRVEGTRSGGTNAISPMQRILMLGSVVWGLVGTALFFLRGKR